MKPKQSNRRLSQHMEPIIRPLIMERKRRRDEAGLWRGVYTQADLEYRIGVPDGYLTRWERGVREPRLFTLSCWAQALDHVVVSIPVKMFMTNDHFREYVNDNFIHANDNFRLDEAIPQTNLIKQPSE